MRNVPSRAPGIWYFGMLEDSKTRVHELRVCGEEATEDVCVLVRAPVSSWHGYSHASGDHQKD